MIDLGFVSGRTIVELVESKRPKLHGKQRFVPVMQPRQWVIVFQSAIDEPEAWQEFKALVAGEGKK